MLRKIVISLKPPVAKAATCVVVSFDLREGEREREAEEKKVKRAHDSSPLRRSSRSLLPYKLLGSSISTAPSISAREPYTCGTGEVCTPNAVALRARQVS